MRKPISFGGAALVLLAGGCSAPAGGEDAENVFSVTQSVTGHSRIDESCPEVFHDFIQTASSTLRAAVPTRAYRETLLRFMVSGLEQADFGTDEIGPYKGCAEDPWQDENLDTVTLSGRVFLAANTENETVVGCDDDSGNARAGMGDDPFFEGDEEFEWDANLDANGQPDGFLSILAADDNRARAAGIQLHELLHQHAFSHGTNSQASAIVACEREDDPDWNFQEHTIPYIAGEAMKYTIRRGASVCGSEVSCPYWALPMAAGFASTDCLCAYDLKNRSFLAAHSAVVL